jgi:hypothetical protein
MQTKLAENNDDGLIKLRTKKSNVEIFILIFYELFHL